MNSNQIFQNAVKENFAFLKGASSVRDAYIRSIEIPEFGFLVPLCDAFASDAQIVEKLTQWRNTNVDAYPTQFVATRESTSRWIKDSLLINEGRILFLVTTSAGEHVGHIGFNGGLNNESRLEIDNVVRGQENAPKGIMSAALVAIVSWAQKIIPVEQIDLRVMAHNEHAIDFYLKNHFVEQCRIPLRRDVIGDTTSFVEITNKQKPDREFIRMVFELNHDVGSRLILTAGPSISAKEAAYAFDAAAEGWNGEWNKYISRFERAFASYVGANYAISVSSCTGALQIALMALDIGPGDEVIVPDETWVASAAAINYVGATPIFADVELDSWNIDSKSIERLVTEKTKAIVAVHMYGGPARMTQIMEIAERHNLKVVEDAAPAIGAEWDGRRVGTFGEFGAFSFQGAKLLVTGEGGMLVTNSKDLYEKARKIADQGRDPAKTFWIDERGVKFKMSNVQAALGLAQIERADELIAMKRRIFGWYKKRLGELPGIYLNEEVPGAKSIYWMTSIRLDKSLCLTRDQLIAELKDRNVDTRPVFPAISQYPIWPLKQEPKPVAFEVGTTAMNLPSGVCLRKDEVDYVCDQIIDLLGLSE